MKLGTYETNVLISKLKSYTKWLCSANIGEIKKEHLVVPREIIIYLTWNNYLGLDKYKDLTAKWENLCDWTYFLIQLPSTNLNYSLQRKDDKENLLLSFTHLM